MLQWLLPLGLLLTACSNPSSDRGNEQAEQIPPVATTQDGRCREPVKTFKDGGAPLEFGVVSSSAAARQIASAYFRGTWRNLPLDEVLRRPIETKLRRGVWHVNTTLPEGLGIKLFVELCQSNGRVLSIYGYQ